MRIFINNFCLSPGGGESPEGLSILGEQPVQVTRFLQTAAASVASPGGRVHTVTFSITREHPSHGDAASFLFTHAATLPLGGNLTFLCEDTAGPQVQYAAAAAAISSDQGTQNGSNTTHRYTLVCGAITGGELA